MFQSGLGRAVAKWSRPCCWWGHTAWWNVAVLAFVCDVDRVWGGGWCCNCNLQVCCLPLAACRAAKCKVAPRSWAVRSTAAVSAVFQPTQGTVACLLCVAWLSHAWQLVCLWIKRDHLATQAMCLLCFRRMLRWLFHTVLAYWHNARLAAAAAATRAQRS